ncbi:MAG: methylmalonyl Co-A mutase-associated GTPase MeaB [Oligoflexia bacterium]|nr:methylmalonyl Co-A mutase-associated GTPase MeaB [Oligoflexia bacterium]
MHFTDQELIDLVPKRDLRAVARLITLSENRAARARTIQSKLFKNTGRAHLIGVTGAPGAGKSTLVDQLALAWRKAGKQVAILAVDPTSPFSGGAILGDRIRMVKTAEDSAVFIRSMATRGALGGLSHAVSDAVRILDAAGFDIILIETVGVGQAEVDIVKTADTCVVVLVPGMGDSVQSIKAGILEIADLFVINKSDREGADLLHRDLTILLSLTELPPEAWKPQIARTIATTGAGVEAIIRGADDHRVWLQSTPMGRTKKIGLVKDGLIKLASDLTLERLLTGREAELAALAEQCADRTLDPYTAVEKLLLRG